MSTAAVMLVKDEADVIEHTVCHLLTQVDRVLVADNLSTDYTYDKLLQMARDDDRLTVESDIERGYYQAQKTTALAQRMLDEGHRWVIPCDADELWFAGDGRPIRDFLDGLGREIQFVKAAIYNHVCTAQDARAFCDECQYTDGGACPECEEAISVAGRLGFVEPNPFKRIGWRQRTHLAMQWGKVACRLRPDLEIHQGNHSASTQGTGTTAYGLEIRHFPYRSPEHFTRKAINGYAAYAATDLDEGIGAHWRVYGRAIEEGGEAAGAAWFYDAFWAENPELDDSLVFDPAPLSLPLSELESEVLE